MVFIYIQSEFFNFSEIFLRLFLLVEYYEVYFYGDFIYNKIYGFVILNLFDFV